MGRSALGLSPSAAALAEEVGCASAMVGVWPVHGRHTGMRSNRWWCDSSYFGGHARAAYGPHSAMVFEAKLFLS